MDSEPGRSVEAHFFVSGVVFLFDSVFWEAAPVEILCLVQNLSVEDGFFLPVLFGIVGIFFYTWSAFTEANRFEAEEVTCGSGIFADTLET